jgi:hypothetical protein
MADQITDPVVIDLSSAYRDRAGRFRLRARIADSARAQELILLAEQYEYRAERLERRRAMLRNAPAPNAQATAKPLVSEPSLVE